MKTKTPAEVSQAVHDLYLRRELCQDLEYLVREDSSIREEIIDEYVYMLDDKRFEELQEYARKELKGDL